MDSDGFSRISKSLDGYEKEMAATLAKMVEIKAMSPMSGGSGEAKRADFLESILRKWGFRVRRYDYLDETKAKRSNLVAKWGNEGKTVWITPHIDTVAEGDATLWNNSPFEAKVANGRVYGRGSNDNGQGVISAMFALKALKESHAKLKYNFGVALAADEETGSKYGVVRLLKEDIFNKGDMIVVPDYGNMRGDKIEISEKSLLWLKVSVKGKQVHASCPQMGANAFRYAIKFLSSVDDYLHKKYSARDGLYATPSTFEMTKHEKNLDSINMIPGSDVFYMDCRILPRYDTDSVLKDIAKVAHAPALRKAKIKVEVVQRDEAPGTNENSEIVKKLKCALKELRDVKARCVGTGGGTLAKYFREKGFDAVVWSTQHDIAHEPNEYAIIKYMPADAKVFAYLCVRD